ncbi:hypothetical protein D3C78_806500 [compost metagenome]
MCSFTICKPSLDRFTLPQYVQGGRFSEYAPYNDCASKAQQSMRQSSLTATAMPALAGIRSFAQNRVEIIL